MFFCFKRDAWMITVVLLEEKLDFMAIQPTPPNVPPPEIAGLNKGVLTIGFP